MDLRLRAVHSLKEKRSVVRPILEGAHRRFGAAAAEVAHQDSLRQATLGVAVGAGSAAHATEVMDAVERFVWSFPEVEVLTAERSWMEG
ncbi:MAG TPA: DUF503 domain-containing protein [Acidimicrobiales bacterium]|nr:DUF503 domain-containing protein [Acidimicrobiales bacterium]